MTSVEEKQKEVVNNVSTPSSSSSESTNEFGRKRRSPPALQVKNLSHSILYVLQCTCVYIVHACLVIPPLYSESAQVFNQLLLEERYIAGIMDCAFTVANVCFHTNVVCRHWLCRFVT